MTRSRDATDAHEASKKRVVTKAKLEPTGALSWRLRIVLPANTLLERVDARLDSLRKRLRMRGFRRGKVPLRIVRRRYEDEIAREEAERLAQTQMRTVLGEHNLRPVAPPKLVIEDLPIDRASADAISPTVEATFEVFPALPSLDLASLEIEIPNVTIDEADIDHMLSKLSPADGEVDTLRQQLADVMENELAEALAEERRFLVEQALLARHPDLELPATLVADETARLRALARHEDRGVELEAQARRSLAVLFLSAAIARHHNIVPDATRLWEHTQHVAERSDDPRAELDRIWGDGDRVHQLEEDLLLADVVETVLAKAQITEASMSFRELADRRKRRTASPVGGG